MTTYRERTYDEVLALARRCAQRPEAHGMSQETADRRVEALVRQDDCSGLIGDPRHQGAHCLCRY